MTKGPKKVAVGKKLDECNHTKREELAKVQKIESEPKLTLSLCYGAGAIVAIGALSVLGYYVYPSKKGDVTQVHQSKERDVTPVRPLETHKLEME